MGIVRVFTNFWKESGSGCPIMDIAVVSILTTQQMLMIYEWHLCEKSK